MATPRRFETLAIRLRARRTQLVIIAAASLFFLLLGILLTAAGLTSLAIAHRFLPGCMGVLMFSAGLFVVQSWFIGIQADRRTHPSAQIKKREALSTVPRSTCALASVQSRRMLSVVQTRPAR
jgi:hypothetical protein